MTDPQPEYVRVLFRLERGRDGYPPVDVEGLWAKPVGEGRYEIDNIPFFVREIAVGDIIEADHFKSEFWFRSVVSRSGHSTIRVIIYQAHLAEMRQTIEQQLSALGCDWEGGHIASLIAVDVPPAAN
jgi:hypothetical protein